MKEKYILILLILIFVSCEKHETDKIIYSLKTEGVFICNEGNYLSANASLSYLDVDDAEIFPTIFRTATGFPLGDIAQSMVILDTVGYIVLNNSGKIYGMNTNTFEYTGKISELNSPRYIQIIDRTKMYVTSLYSKEITIINPTTYEITGSIYTDKTTEQICQYDDYVFVTNWSFNNTIQRIDCVTDELLDAVEVPKQPNSIVLDKDDKLWVLCDGGFEGSSYGQDTAALCRMDPSTLDIEQMFTFPSLNESPSRLTINSTKDTLYFLVGNWNATSTPREGVHAISIYAISIPEKPLIPEYSRNLYGLAADPEKAVLYVSDAIDYLQNGWIYRYTSSGAVIDSFRTGIAPSYFCFKTIEN